MTAVKVLLVDDSATVRAVLKRMLGASEGIEIVGEATDGQEAVALTARLRPDVVLMDLNMPTLDGMSASALIAERCPTPIVVVTSQGTPKQIAAAFQSVKTGVVGIFPKPEMPEGWAELSRNLIDTLREIGAPRSAPGPRRGKAPPVASDSRPRVVAVGASTGGPAALCDMLRALAPSFGAGIAVVQHIAEGFEAGLVEWLRLELQIDVDIAQHGQLLLPGAVRLAPPGHHLRVSPEGIMHLDQETAPVRGHRPSVDILFESLLDHDPRGVAAVLLTGMGSDGANGLLALHQAGALTVAQEEMSCAVFGMPRRALELGATELVLAPCEIGRLLAKAMRGALR